MKLFLRLSELFCLLNCIRTAIGCRRARDTSAHADWSKTPGRNDVTQRPSSRVTSHIRTPQHTETPEQEKP